MANRYGRKQKRRAAAHITALKEYSHKQQKTIDKNQRIVDDLYYIDHFNKG